MNIMERFMAKVSPEPNTGCWLWTGGTAGKDYSSFKYDGDYYGHRVSYRLFVGPIPEGLIIDHKCRVHCCVNPGHLEPVTYAVNIKRGIGPRILGDMHLAKTHCPKGHSYSGDNLAQLKSGPQKGARRCKTCVRLQQKAWYERSKEVA